MKTSDWHRAQDEVHGHCEHGAANEHAQDHPNQGFSGHSAAASGDSARDPVCGMTVKHDAQYQATYAGAQYFFCSSACQKRFEADPTRYVEEQCKSALDEAEATPGTTYTCPMHPEIRQDHPGTCPKCGMALEPVMPSLEDDKNPELVAFRHRFWWTLPLTVAVVLLVMLENGFTALDPVTQSWVELALSVPVVLWAGSPIYDRCLQSFRNRSPNMWTLIGLGTGAAFVYSVVATVAPGLFPGAFVMHGRIAVYFEAAAVIISLTLLGQIFELKARSQTSAAIKSLLGLAPKTARRLNPDGKIGRAHV